MGAQRRLARVKGALLALLRDAYARRDRVAVVAFRDAAARASLDRARRAARARRRRARARCRPAGARRWPPASTPPSCSSRREALREPEPPLDRRRAHRRPRRSDPDGAVAARGRARSAAPPTAVHVVDTEEGPVRLGLAARSRAAAGGRVHRLVPVTRSRRAA